MRSEIEIIETLRTKNEELKELDSYLDNKLTEDPDTIQAIWRIRAKLKESIYTLEWVLQIN